MSGYENASSAGYYHHGYHGYHHPLVKCERVVETVTKKLCRIEVEKECVTKTKTFKKITGYEDGECKEIEVCKHGKNVVTDTFCSENDNK